MQPRGWKATPFEPRSSKASLTTTESARRRGCFFTHEEDGENEGDSASLKPEEETGRVKGMAVDFWWEKNPRDHEPSPFFPTYQVLLRFPKEAEERLRSPESDCNPAQTEGFTFRASVTTDLPSPHLPPPPVQADAPGSLGEGSVPRCHSPAIGDCAGLGCLSVGGFRSFRARAG